MPEANQIGLDQQAEEDFSKARTRELLSRIQNFFNPDADELLSLQEVKDIIRPKGENYQGMRPVPIALIVGSEGRYHDFNKAFLPKTDHVRARWKSIDKAHLTDVNLPPIRLYEIGGLYFVRDGNHRVSVARHKGMAELDAEVTSLNSELKLSPGMSREELLSAVIAYEKDSFYEATMFGPVTDYYNLDFSTPGQYDIIYHHIQVHKYFINMASSREIPMVKAVRSWYENLYRPIALIIETDNLCKRFPGRTTADLYVWIVKHWDSLKKVYGTQYTLDEAIKDYAESFGEDPAPVITRLPDRILARLRKIFAVGERRRR